jgi:membrane protein implicated in regulation of membrane protease activity
VLLLLLAIVLAIFVLSKPWGVVAVVVAVAIEVVEIGVFRWWSQRRRAGVGLETLLGRRAVVMTALAPVGQVKIDGEVWGARCEVFVDPGTHVVVQGVDDLTLVVEPLREAA